MYLIVLSTNIFIYNYSLVDGHESQGYVFSVDVSIVAKNVTYFLILTVNVLMSLIFVIFPAHYIPREYFRDCCQNVLQIGSDLSFTYLLRNFNHVIEMDSMMQKA